MQRKTHQLMSSKQVRALMAKYGTSDVTDFNQLQQTFAEIQVEEEDDCERFLVNCDVRLFPGVCGGDDCEPPAEPALKLKPTWEFGDVTPLFQQFAADEANKSATTLVKEEELEAAEVLEQGGGGSSAPRRPSLPAEFFMYPEIKDGTTTIYAANRRLNTSTYCIEFPTNHLDEVARKTIARRAYRSKVNELKASEWTSKKVRKMTRKLKISNLCVGVINQ
jgi:hypothetical protein